MSAPGTPGDAAALAGRRVLVTGAAGFVGVNVCRALAAAGAEPVGLVRPAGTRWRLPALGDAAEVVEVDLRDFDGLRRTVTRRPPEIVVHAAARSPYDRDAPLRTVVADDLLGLAHLLDVLAHLPCERLILLGSSLEYGPSEAPHREDDPLRPASRRGVVRAAATLLAHQAGREQELETVALRLFSVYGPWEPPHRLIPRAIRAALAGDELPLTPPGLRRDPVFVDDVAEACLRAATAPGLAGETINVGSGRQVTNEEIVAAVGRATGRPIATRPGAYPPHGTDRTCWVADVARARELLAWRARHTLGEGLARTVAWHERTGAWPA